MVKILQEIAHYSIQNTCRHSHKTVQNQKCWGHLLIPGLSEFLGTVDSESIWRRNTNRWRTQTHDAAVRFNVIIFSQTHIINSRKHVTFIIYRTLDWSTVCETVQIMGVTALYTSVQRFGVGNIFTKIFERRLMWCDQKK